MSYCYRPDCEHQPCESEAPTELTHEERQRLIRAPISVGILANHRYGGAGSAGNGQMLSVPTLDKYGRVTGRMSTPARSADYGGAS